MTPLVTIIIPTIGSRYLRQAADSAVNQVYKNVQVLIVADGPNVDLHEIQHLDKVDAIRLPYNTGAGGTTDTESMARAPISQKAITCAFSTKTIGSIPRTSNR